jgi:hypothetical protein
MQKFLVIDWSIVQVAFPSPFFWGRLEHPL